MLIEIQNGKRNTNLAFQSENMRVL